MPNWIEEPPDWIVDWSQIAGAVFSLVALVIALVAIGVSKRDIGKERRRQHELEILRRVAELLEARHFRDQEEELSIKSQIAAQLILLPTEDLPSVRAAISAGATKRQMIEFKSDMVRYLSRPDIRSNLNDEAMVQLSPHRSEEEILDMASGFDHLRWRYVVTHIAAGDSKTHIYGYTSDSIAHRELFCAIDARLG